MSLELIDEFKNFIKYSWKGVEIEYRYVEYIWMEDWREFEMENIVIITKIKRNIGNIWGMIEKLNICVIWVIEERERIGLK